MEAIEILANVLYSLIHRKNHPHGVDHTFVMAFTLCFAQQVLPCPLLELQYSLFSGFDLIAVEFNLSLGDQVKVPEVTVLQMKKRNGTERRVGGGKFSREHNWTNLSWWIHSSTLGAY